MNIVVVNGTDRKGCTYRMKEIFLHMLGGHNVVKEYFLPKDCPVFCEGCKACFYKDISVCPHAAYTQPIWWDIAHADLLVFTSPVYVWHATGQMKTLLDHFGSKWMAHSPDALMFTKQAVIIASAVGMGLRGVLRDIGHSLTFWGVPRVYAIKQALFYADWAMVSDKNKKRIDHQCARVSRHINHRGGRVKPTVKIRLLFNVMRIAHIMIQRTLHQEGQPDSTDYLYWKEHGWLGSARPWKH